MKIKFTADELERFRKVEAQLRALDPVKWEEMEQDAKLYPEGPDDEREEHTG